MLPASARPVSSQSGLRRGDVGVARGVDDHVREQRLAAGLRLGDDADHPVAIEQRRHDQSVQHRVHAGLQHEMIGDDLEALGIELLRE